MRDDHGFCSYCGSRVIGDRISLKFIFNEFLDKVLSVDNKLLKTFWHLFTKPEKVIEGYVNGVRKRYYNPFSYLLISITLAGLATLITRDIAMEAIAAANQVNNNASVQFTEQMMDIIFDYQSFLTIASIPLYAFVSWIVFLNKKKFNYLEHNIVYVYTSAQLSIINFLIVGLLFIIQIDFFVETSIAISILLVAYNSYVAIRLFKLSFLQFIVKTLYFLFIGAVLYVVVSIIMVIGMVIFLGKDYFKQFAPIQKNDSIQKVQPLDSLQQIQKKDSIQKDGKTISFYEASSKLNCLS